jgi:hypothetical protein
MKIHLPITTLEPRGRGTSSHVPLLIRAPYSSSIATHQFKSARVAWTEVGMEGVGVEEAMVMRVTWSQGSQNPSLAPCDHRVRVNRQRHGHDHGRVVRWSRGC